ncbi:hypothetical protein HPP92_005877 [Vanilla planifolia]|uniref:Nodulation signaling pathway 1-like protein n=1 Tax=Vanilla planifolia TaxID=51239 RepID=A0A835RNM9_VANPL|nr:hypothetical protein HPP92_005877 [Vanilla planifolia]
MDWLDESWPYTIPESTADYDWWAQEQNQSHRQSNPTANTAPKTTVEKLPAAPHSELSKKRKLRVKQQAPQRRTNILSGNQGSDRNEEERKPQNWKKGTLRKVNSGNSSCEGGCRDARWAEQLLNPLAAAIDAANLSRAQHLLYVLQELASQFGDTNQRLAFYGLQALTRQLSTVGIGGNSLGSASMALMMTTDTRAFLSALMKFHEVNPWFAVPNCLANMAIMTVAAGRRRLHVVDMGVSHGLQWPTLLEALARRVGGAPNIVTLTAARDGAGGPFGSTPVGYDYGPQLMRYAKSIGLNLRVEREDALLGMGMARQESEATVVVLCGQFRAERAGLGLLSAVREMEPDLVVLSETEKETEEEGGGKGSFGSRSELLWRFLESTSAAFNGRECEERRIVEAEAARFLEEEAGREGRERWKERMHGAGFRKESFGEDAVETGKDLLRKYDGNWELKVVNAAVVLLWKGTPVSFCSLWKPTVCL